MHRVDTDGNEDGLFQDGTPQIGQQGTILSDDWFNDVQENICTVIEDAGIELEKGDHDQLKLAIAAMIAAGGAAYVPAGSTITFAAAAAPAGWLECDGAVVLRATYPGLFAAIGTVFNTGGESGAQFRLPDLRGEFVRGWDHGRGIDAGRALGSGQAEDLKAHSHSLPVYNDANSGTVGVEDSDGTGTARSISTGSTGGTETRPRNVALMWIIKT